MALEAVLSPAQGAIETPAAWVWLRSNGVACCVLKAGTRMDLDSSLEINRVILGFSDPPMRRPILTDISAPHETDPAVRRHAASQVVVDATLKLGLIVRTPVARMLGNAFIRAKRPPYPTRLFTAEEPALEWLEDGWSMDV